MENKKNALLLLVKSLIEILNSSYKEIYDQLQQCDNDPHRATEELLQQEKFKEVGNNPAKREEIGKVLDSYSKGKEYHVGSNSGRRTDSEQDVVQTGSSHVTYNEPGTAIREDSGPVTSSVTSSTTHSTRENDNIDHRSLIKQWFKEIVQFGNNAQNASRSGKSEQSSSDSYSQPFDLTAIAWPDVQENRDTPSTTGRRRRPPYAVPVPQVDVAGDSVVSNKTDSESSPSSTDTTLSSLGIIVVSDSDSDSNLRNISSSNTHSPEDHKVLSNFKRLSTGDSKVSEEQSSGSKSNRSIFNYKGFLPSASRHKRKISAPYLDRSDEHNRSDVAGRTASVPRSFLTREPYTTPSVIGRTASVPDALLRHEANTTPSVPDRSFRSQLRTPSQPYGRQDLQSENLYEFPRAEVPSNPMLTPGTGTHNSQHRSAPSQNIMGQSSTRCQQSRGQNQPHTDEPGGYLNLPQNQPYTAVSINPREAFPRDAGDGAAGGISYGYHQRSAAGINFNHLPDLRESSSEPRLLPTTREAVGSPVYSRQQRSFSLLDYEPGSGTLFRSHRNTPYGLPPVPPQSSLTPPHESSRHSELPFQTRNPEQLQRRGSSSNKPPAFRPRRE